MLAPFVSSRLVSSHLVLRRFFSLLLVLLLHTLTPRPRPVGNGVGAAASGHPWSRPEAPSEFRASSLLAAMTLEEKLLTFSRPSSLPSFLPSFKSNSFKPVEVGVRADAYTAIRNSAVDDSIGAS